MQSIKPQLQIVWIIDITGSMQSQITAVKESAARTAELVNEDKLPVQFILVTYTEESSKSVATYQKFKSADEAVKQIRSLKLCVPPGTDLNLSGGDGDENVKLAIAKFHKEHDFSIPSVVFFITDAGYHEFDREKSGEAKEEEAELKRMGYTTDVIKIFRQINFEKVFFFPMTSLSNYSSPCNHTYTQFAMETGGMHLTTVRVNEKDFTEAMVKIISSIFLGLVMGEKPEIDGFPSFKVLDSSEVVLRDSENDMKFGAGKEADEEMAKKIITKTMDRVVKVVGKGWTKRKISLNSISLFNQIKVVALSIRYLIGEEEHRDQIVKLIDTIKKNLDEDQLKHVKLSIGMIDEMKTMINFSKIEEEGKDLLTLSTAKEVAEETPIEEVISDFTASVCSALYGLPAKIDYQEDEDGNIDFTSAWDSVIKDVGIDLYSLKTFLEMLKHKGDDGVTGMTDRKSYNAFIPLCGKPGTFRWVVFKIVSSLQVLDAAMSLSVGSPITEVIPNLHAGIVSRALLFMTKNKVTESSANRIRELLVTIEAFSKTPAKNVVKLYSQSRVSPSENIGKLILVWYRVSKDDEILRKILREYVTDNFMKYFKKSTPENDKRYREYLAEFFVLKDIMGEFSESLDELHLLERREITNQGIEDFVKKEVKSSSDSINQAAETLDEYLKSDQLKGKIQENSFFKKFRFQSQILWTLLHCNVNDENIPEFANIDEFYPQVYLDFVESLMLRKRTARYNTVVDEENNVDHQVKQIESCHSQIFTLLKKIHKATIRDRESQREANFKQQMKKNVDEKLSDFQDLTAEEMNEFLKANVIAFNNKTYCLSRVDLLDKIKSFDIPLSIISVIIEGDWSKEVPQVLRKYLIEIQKALEARGTSEEEISVFLEPVKAMAVCMRTKKSNRKGHSEKLRYPGPHRWTEEYEKARLAEGGKKKYLQAMKIFTTIYKAIEEVEGMEVDVLESIVSQFHDAFTVHKFIKTVRKQFKKLNFYDVIKIAKGVPSKPKNPTKAGTDGPSEKKKAKIAKYSKGRGRGRGRGRRAPPATRGRGSRARGGYDSRPSRPEPKKPKRKTREHDSTFDGWREEIFGSKSRSTSPDPMEVKDEDFPTLGSRPRGRRGRGRGR